MTGDKFADLLEVLPEELNGRVTAVILGMGLQVLSNEPDPRVRLLAYAGLLIAECETLRVWGRRMETGPFTARQMLEAFSGAETILAQAAADLTEVLK